MLLLIHGGAPNAEVNSYKYSPWFLLVDNKTIVDGATITMNPQDSLFSIAAISADKGNTAKIGDRKRKSMDYFVGEAR